MFNKNNVRKRSKLHINKRKSMRIPDRICRNNNKLFVIVNPRNVCKLVFADHLWLPFHDQPQSDVVVVSIIYFRAYKNILTEWKHGISINDIITFNKTLENVST